MGKADAKQIGENSQENVIAKWKEEMWIPLAKTMSAQAAASDDDDDDDDDKDDVAVAKDVVNVKEMQAGVIPILMKIDPEYNPPKEFGGRSFSGGIPTHLVVLAVIVALIAALFVTGTIQAS